jgi:Ulp1 family protease
LTEQKVLFRLENRKTEEKSAVKASVRKKSAKAVKKVAKKKTAKKKMSAAQREKISKALDRALVSSEPHELRQVLATHGKKESERNVKILGEALADFKKGRFKPKNRERFYRYLKEANVLRKLHISLNVYDTNQFSHRLLGDREEKILALSCINGTNLTYVIQDTSE